MVFWSLRQHAHWSLVIEHNNAIQIQIIDYLKKTTAWPASPRETLYGPAEEADMTGAGKGNSAL